MTPLQLNKIGIVTEKTKSNPNRYWCNTTQCYYTITKNHTMEDVLEMVFSKGYELGIYEGKGQRSREIKKLLNIS